MCSLSHVLGRASELGVTLRVKDGSLVAFPKEALDNELRESIRENANELAKLLSPPGEGLGWEGLRHWGAKLGHAVTARGKAYQLWGMTPRGAICFDGKVLLTLDLGELGA